MADTFPKILAYMSAEREQGKVKNRVMMKHLQVHASHCCDMGLDQRPFPLGSRLVMLLTSTFLSHSIKTQL